MLLQNNVHILISAISVIFVEKYFRNNKNSETFFKSTTESEIHKYVKENKEAVFSSVGSYRIEDNKKNNLVEVLSGDNETIIGFPIKKFIRKIRMSDTLLVLGNPIKHSKSPLIHNYWLKKYRINARYNQMCVGKDELTKYVDLVRNGKLKGCNITVPYKRIFSIWLIRQIHMLKEVWR